MNHWLGECAPLVECLDLVINNDFRYEHMQLLPVLDNLLYNVQRQGKISFYVRSSIFA
jgi:hypothetical protein